MFREKYFAIFFISKSSNFNVARSLVESLNSKFGSEDTFLNDTPFDEISEHDIDGGFDDRK